MEKAIEILTLVLSIITAATVLVTRIQQARLEGKVDANHDAMNGHMQALLSVSKEASRLEGVAEGREQQKRDPDDNVK